MKNKLKLLSCWDKVAKNTISKERHAGCRFKSNYDQFCRNALNFANPYFELRHPYLLHPYISERLILSLIEDYHIAGIGSDTYGLENPLIFSNERFLPPFSKDLFKSRKKSIRPLVLAKLMTYRKIYIKNLKNIPETGNKSFKKGKITIIPLVLGNIDANICRVFLKENE